MKTATMKEMTDLYKMLEQLHEVAVEQPRAIGNIAFGLKRDEIAMQIAKIKASLPKEVRTAENVAREKERIVEQAVEEAAGILERAQAEAQSLREAAALERDELLRAANAERERLVEEHEVLRLAKTQAEEIRLAAEQDASLTRRGAEDYAYTILKKLDSLGTKIQSHAREGMTDLERAEQQPQLAIAVAREKART